MSTVNDSAPPNVARWLRISLRARGVAVMAVPMAALFTVFFAVYWVEVDARQADDMLQQAYDARAELQQLDHLLGDAGEGVRGYLATRREEFLEPYETARRSVEPSLESLMMLVRAEDAAVLAQTEQAAREQMRILGDLAAQPAGTSVMAALLATSRQVNSEFHARLARLAQAEEQRVSRARSDKELLRNGLFRTIVACGFFGPLGALIMHMLVSGRLTRRIRALERNARKLAEGTALEALPRGTDEIAAVARAIRDASDLLRERERELRESELRYRNLFDHAPLPFEETDCEGIIRRVNQAGCALVKSSPDQLLGLPAWYFLVPGAQDEFQKAMLDRIASCTEIAPYECVYQIEDGTSITVEIRESLIRNERGAVTGVCRSLVDITERNLAEMAARKVAQYAMELRNKNEQLAQALEAARSAVEAKSQFLASMSHELRTPLNAIIGFSELLYDGKLGGLSDDHRECLQDILTSARHLLRLISDILDLSKVEAGKMEFCPEACHIEALVAEVRDVIRPLAEKKRIELLTDIPWEIPAMIDASRFKQVLYNYLSNAVKFTPEGGWITIRVAVEGLKFRLEVEDTGIGIHAEEISKLFQEFQQLPNSRKAGQGTGLGLALTRRIVEAQGGIIGVRSTPGIGSVFSAVLPLRPAPVVATLARVS
jgi:PAS domain S-box-containing protein